MICLRRAIVFLLLSAMVVSAGCGGAADDDSQKSTAGNLRKEFTEQERAAQTPPSEDLAASEPSPPSDDDSKSKAQSAGAVVSSTARYEALIAGLTIFVLAIFVGFEVITKVPATLHTPLMSGSNAISGITLVGAAILAARGLQFSPFFAFLAVILATINVVGGFLVTHRMLAMFKKR